MDPATASSVASRARTENFPVASLLFPRALRPRLRAIYGFARLVDMLGDEVPGDRLAAMDELEAQLEACYEGEPTWEVMRELQPTIGACSLPRELFLRLIEANRMDQRVTAYETWADLKHYCVHSADPVGRLVLGVIGRGDDAAAVALSDDVCTGLQLVNFLQDVPRDLALGRVDLPAEDRRRFGVGELDRPSADLRRLLEFEAARARGFLASGEELGRLLGGGRVGRAGALFARRGAAVAAGAGRSRCSPAAGWRRWRRSSGRTGTSSPAGRVHLAQGWRWRRFGERRRCLRRGRAADSPRGAQLRLRDPRAAEGEAARDLRHLRLRAPRGRRGRRRAAGRGEA